MSAPIAAASTSVLNGAAMAKWQNPVAASAPQVSAVTIEQLCQQIVQLLPAVKSGSPQLEVFRELEVYLACAAVERTHGNKQAAANLLGIYRPRLYNLLKQSAARPDEPMLPALPAVELSAAEPSAVAGVMV